MHQIVLATLNARYIHSALGLRYLRANMGELRPVTAIREFTLDARPVDVAEALLREAPAIVGFGVYIWNVEQTARLVALLKALRPDIVIVLGGPEVSHGWREQPIAALADYVIAGPADRSFAALCRAILAGGPPQDKLIEAPVPALRDVALPYAEYTDEDIAQRVVYVEASRGCPFKCEFCLSALDRSAWRFDLDDFLGEMSALYARGARQFKFVDRTFNLDVATATAILEFFLARPDPDLFLHFEAIPDRLPERLKAVLARFPPGALQLEIGVQSFDSAVQALIDRRQDAAATRANLAWLRANTHAHLHADLILGLPGEDLEGFGRGFDELVALGPHEIQVGVLKRLRGAPIARHSAAFDMRYDPSPPYAVLSTDRIGFGDMQRLKRFARYWDMLGNSGRFRAALPAILGGQPFRRFLALSDWLYARTGQTHHIALRRLFRLVYDGMTTLLDVDRERAAALLAADCPNAVRGGRPAFLEPADHARTGSRGTRSPKARQQRHNR
jgi:radical SAM superfamily enzyme YgiQ (UPF0313 family)